MNGVRMYALVSGIRRREVGALVGGFHALFGDSFMILLERAFMFVSE